MSKINYEWISGTIPRNILQQNMDAFCSFANASDKEDGFLHLLGRITAAYPMQGTLTYAVDAPYQFFYIYEGAISILREEDPEHIYQIPQGHAALLPAGGVTTLRIEKARCRYFHMYLKGMSLDEYHNILSEPFYYSTESSSVLSLSDFLDRLNALQPTSDDFVFLCKTSMWITDLLTEMVIYKEKPETKAELIPEYIADIHHMFETHCNENYTLDDLENTYEISKYRICREFTKYYKQSPIQFLNHVRIANAKKLLLTTDANIREVGESVGIPNTNHFINLFKRETGATPLAFKQDAPVSISELHYL